MQHLACIMDGNRRWAKKNSLRPWLGHRKGAESIREVIKFCLNNNIHYLSLFTFSIENFNRSKQECTYLFNLITQEAQNHLGEFIQNGIRVRFIGNRALFPESTKSIIEQLEHKTEQNTQLNVNFLFCYGARQEIIDAIKMVVRKVKAGLLAEDEISEASFFDYLWTRGVPEPDLIIRTGGAVRLSNFLLYQSAYSEFYFLDCLWPDISQVHLQKALGYFNDCKRNFGS
ncbi:MAG: polyprenyl diphosphate synthase [Candidatus Babeliales bacterium]